MFSWSLAGAGERTEDVISRALFYDLLNKAEVHDTYKDLLSSVTGPEKSMKSASRIILEKSKILLPLCEIPPKKLSAVVILVCEYI